MRETGREMGREIPQVAALPRNGMIGALATNGARGRLTRVLDEQGGLVGPAPDLSPEELRALYEWMVRVRALDARMLKLQRQGRISFYVPSLGEEAAQIGTASVLQPEDWAFPAYREQGVLLYRGFPLDLLVAQCLATGGDLLKGRQMPNHFGSARLRFAVASSPVGTQIPHAVGAAWGMRLRGENGVAVVYFGDGATSTGDFHAGLNFAAVRQLPVVFFCKNNGWAISTPRSAQTRAEYLTDKALGYGMPGVRVDGNDLLAVRQCAHQAVEHARSGGGPVLVEIETQRMGPHSTSDDPSRYRAAELLEPWKERDPLTLYRRYLEGRRLWEDADEDRIRQDAEGRVAEAVQRVETQAAPALETLFTDVYAEMPWHLQEQRDEALEAERQRAGGEGGARG